ncbi:UNVERIFIED_CONTAM: hypothetical protein Slati_2168300 [Sesamum latifolium]|uniref:Uncharacterized protein n=1 Tax=Sesamum latifolium TaxID=2727402 RepID=A0AAW2WT60_9LAMI
MEAFLQGQDLRDLIEGDEISIPTDTSQNAELRRKWKIKCSKALFFVRTSINKEYIDHVRDLKSPIWETLQKLCTKKNTARLQFLENELAMATQELDTEEPVSDARLHRYLISGLRKDLMPFISSPTSVTSVVHQDDVSTYIRASIKYNEEWIVDSGCSHHATGNDILLSDIHPHREKKDVYHVPGLKKYLASVSQITDSGRGESHENEPKLYSEGKGVSEWENAMVEEISALSKNGTWELTPKPYDADLITCK